MRNWSRWAAWDGGFESKVLTIVSIGWFTVFAARMVINTLLPEIKQAYVLTNSQAGLIVTSLGVTYAAMQFPSGILADLFGEVRVLITVLFGTAVITVALGGAPALWVFVPVTILFGVVSGSYYTVSTSLLSQIFPARQGWALGIQSSVGSFSGVIAPAIAAAVVSVGLGWRTAFFFAGGLCLLTGFGLYTIDAEVRGILVGAADAAGPPETEAERADTADGSGVTGQFVDTLRLFSNGYLLLLTGMYCLLMFVRWGIDAFFTIYVTESKGLSLAVAASLFGLMYAVGIIVKPIAGALADRIGDQSVITGCIALQSCSLLLFVYVGSTAAIAASVVLFSVGLMGFPAVLQSHFLRFVPEEERASAFGMYRSTYLLVASSSPVVIGTVADITSLDIMLLLLTGISAVGLAGFVVGKWIVGMPSV